MTPLYKDYTSEVSIFLRSFFGLAFLPPSEVGDCFAFDLVTNRPEDKRLDQFPPHIWADYSETCTRTTNNCESFHAKFNSMFNSSSPNIYEFLQARLEIQSGVYLKMRSVGTK